MAVPNLINGAQTGATQALRHDAVSILTGGDIYSSFPPERGGRHRIFTIMGQQIGRFLLLLQLL